MCTVFFNVENMSESALIMTVVKRSQVHRVMVTVMDCHPVNSARVRLLLMEDEGQLGHFLPAE